MVARRNPRLKKANTEHEYTFEQITEIQKCMADPAYFCRNYIYIKHPIDGQIKFDLFDYQTDIMERYVKNRYNIILSARQTGKTETTCAYLLWFAMFQTDKTILIVSNKSDNAKEIIAKIQNAYEELPHWLKPGIDENSWNKHTCTFDNKSRIVATTTASDSGRGMAISLLYCDEFAFVKHHIQNEFWDSILPTLSTGGACIISSTPNGDTNLFAKIWRGAKLETNEFVPVHIPWDAFPGRGAEFKKEKIGLLGLRKWEQEFECKFISSDHNLFDGRCVGDMEKRNILDKIEPLFHIDEQPFWAHIDKDKSYIVGVDPASGSGNDHSVIEVFEFPSLIQVSEFRSNKLDAPLVYTRLKKILKYLEHFTDDVYFSIENNGVGQAMIALYQTDQAPPEKSFFISQGNSETKLGFTTTDKSKMKTCLQFKNLFEKMGMRIFSEVCLTEMKNYVRKGSAYAAQVGATDDCVSAINVVFRIMEEIAQHDPRAFDKLYVVDMEGGAEGDEWINDPSQTNNINDVPMPFSL